MADTPAELYDALMWHPDHAGRKSITDTYTWFDRFHPSAYLHRRLAELIALDVLYQLQGQHPGLPT